MEDGLVLPHVAVALGGAQVVVEGDAGRDDVDHAQPVVRDGGLQDGLQLLLVAAKGAGDEGGAPLEGQRAAVKGGQIVDGAGLKGGADVRGGRKLSLGQAVNTIDRKSVV